MGLEFKEPQLLNHTRQESTQYELHQLVPWLFLQGQLTWPRILWKLVKECIHGAMERGLSIRLLHQVVFGRNFRLYPDAGMKLFHIIVSFEPSFPKDETLECSCILFPGAHQQLHFFWLHNNQHFAVQKNGIWSSLHPSKRNDNTSSLLLRRYWADL